MPYISAEQVKEKREQLKKAFPDWKLSVVTRHNSEICVYIMESPVNFGVEYEQVNQYYIKEHYQGEQAKALQKIADIISKGVRELVYDSDYGSVPTFYYSISIGKWDKPFKFVK